MAPRAELALLPMPSEAPIGSALDSSVFSTDAVTSTAGRGRAPDVALGCGARFASVGTVLVSAEEIDDDRDAGTERRLAAVIAL
jgi:hypothetical protein